MIIKKCDICKKEIKKGNQEIAAGLGWPQFSFCASCGRPIALFLKKRKLIPGRDTKA